jgi:hypothetical protein
MDAKTPVRIRTTEPSTIPKTIAVAPVPTLGKGKIPEGEMLMPVNEKDRICAIDSITKAIIMPSTKDTSFLIAPKASFGLNRTFGNIPNLSRNIIPYISPWCIDL